MDDRRGGRQEAPHVQNGGSLGLTPVFGFSRLPPSATDAHKHPCVVCRYRKQHNVLSSCTAVFPQASRHWTYARAWLIDALDEKSN
jgi:hypothetical protein